MAVINKMKCRFSSEVRVRVSVRVRVGVGVKGHLEGRDGRLVVRVNDGVVPPQQVAEDLPVGEVLQRDI